MRLLFLSLTLLLSTEGALVTHQSFTLQTGESALISFDLSQFMNIVLNHDPAGHLPRQIGIYFVGVPPSGPLPPLEQPIPGYSFSVEWLTADLSTTVASIPSLEMLHSTVQSGAAVASAAYGFEWMVVTQSAADAAFASCCTPGGTDGVLRFTNLGSPFTFTNLVYDANGPTFVPGTANQFFVFTISDVNTGTLQSSASIVAINTTGVPEPAAGSLVGLGILALATLPRLRRSKSDHSQNI